MRIASRAAFFAPCEPMASVPTGTPPGICTIASSASSPPSALAVHRHAEHGQQRLRRDDARQMGRQAGGGDDHFQAALFGRSSRIRSPAPASGGPRPLWLRAARRIRRESWPRPAWFPNRSWNPSECRREAVDCCVIAIESLRELSRCGFRIVVVRIRSPQARLLAATRIASRSRRHRLLSATPSQRRKQRRLIDRLHQVMVEAGLARAARSSGWP